MEQFVSTPVQRTTEKITELIANEDACNELTHSISKEYLCEKATTTGGRVRGTRQFSTASTTTVRCHHCVPAARLRLGISSSRRRHHQYNHSWWLLRHFYMVITLSAKLYCLSRTVKAKYCVALAFVAPPSLPLVYFGWTPSLLIRSSRYRPPVRNLAGYHFSSRASYNSSTSHLADRAETKILGEQQAPMGSQMNQRKKAQPFKTTNGRGRGIVQGEDVNEDEKIHVVPGGPKKAARAKVVPATSSSIASCAVRLRCGQLVAFPTETVYGLGCNAFDEEAAKKIFAAKERPYTDPLIVHVANPNVALSLWDLSATRQDSSEEELFFLVQKIIKTYWPGPLTIICRAEPGKVPDIIMAGTGFVAVRCPSHPLARKLIEEAGVPVAAPSANKFGHVSPTRASHVYEDLSMEDVWIVDPTVENNESEDGEDVCDGLVVAKTPHGKASGSGIVCDVGVESSVIKIDSEAKTISVLRHGAVSGADIRACLSADFDYDTVRRKAKLGYVVLDDVGTHGRSTPTTATPLSCGATDNHSHFSAAGTAGVEIKENISASAVENEALDTVASTRMIGQISPGQELRHYSPNVPSYMISSRRCRQCNRGAGFHEISLEDKSSLTKSVIVDYGNQLGYVKDVCLAYRDLSPSANSSEAASNLFEFLRWAEAVNGVQVVYFPQIVEKDDGKEILAKDCGCDVGYVDTMERNDALELALNDRLTRAASGIVLDDFQ